MRYINDRETLSTDSTIRNKLFERLLARFLTSSAAETPLACPLETGEIELRSCGESSERPKLLKLLAFETVHFRPHRRRRGHCEM